MDEQEKQLEEWSLEEILKEFSQSAEDQPEEEDILIWDDESSRQEQEKTESLHDTMRLDEIKKAVAHQQENLDLEQTVAFTPVGEEGKAPDLEKTVAFAPVGTEGKLSDMEQTVAFIPVDIEEEAPYPQIYEEQPESVEPYSDTWEPEYEQPMGEYIPAEPIVFRPKSRLGELKRKLVAGPEKRYYELSEMGLGKLQLAILFSVLVVILAVGSTVLHAVGWLPQERTRTVVYIQFLSLLLSALLGSYQLMEGFTDMLKKRFSLNSLLIFSLIACLLDSVFCLQQVRVPCCSVFSIHMTMSLWSAYQKRSTELGQMDTLRKATRLDGVALCPDYYDGRSGFLRTQGQVEDFMDHYREDSVYETYWSWYALVALMVSFAIGVLTSVLLQPVMGVQAFAATLLISVPAGSYIALSRPGAILQRRLHKLGTVVCGWRGIQGLCADGVFPLEDTDLFPAGAAKLNGVKFYGKRDPDQIVAYAAALMNVCGGGMAPLFSQLLEERNGHHYDAQLLRAYSGGIGGEVNEEAVLAGSLQCMQDLGVDMPQGTRVEQAIYLAIDGELCGVFAISYGKTKSAAAGLTTLCAYRKLTPVMIGNDFMLTENFLRSKFGVNTRQIAFPKREVRKQLQEKTLPEDARALALTTRDGLAAISYGVTGARALRSSMNVGTVVQMFSGILGLVIMLVLALVGAEYLLTPVNVLLYEVLWLIPGLLITEWTRNV